MRDIHCVIVENNNRLVPVLERELSWALAPEYRLISDDRDKYEDLDGLLNTALDDEASGAPQLFVVDLFRDRSLRRLAEGVKALWGGRVLSDASAKLAEAKYLYDAVMDETIPKLRALRGRVGVGPVIVAISYIPKLLDAAPANADAITLRTAVRENVDMLIEKISSEQVASEDFRRVKQLLEHRHSNE